MGTNRGIWEDEEAFLGPFKGVAKEGGTSSSIFWGGSGGRGGRDGRDRNF